MPLGENRRALTCRLLLRGDVRRAELQWLVCCLSSAGDEGRYSAEHGNDGDLLSVHRSPPRTLSNAVSANTGRALLPKSPLQSSKPILLILPESNAGTHPIVPSQLPLLGRLRPRSPFRVFSFNPSWPSWPRLSGHTSPAFCWRRQGLAGARPWPRPNPGLSCRFSLGPTSTLLDAAKPRTAATQGQRRAGYHHRAACRPRPPQLTRGRRAGHQ